MKPASLKKALRLLVELAVICALFLLGGQIASWLGWPIPAGVMGLALLLLLFASGQSRLVSARLRELLKLICSADALHVENLGAWLADDEGRTLLWELVKQGSLGFADE